MNWKSEDSAKFRDYLQKSQFRLRTYLQSRIPLCDGKTIEEVALKARYKEGFERALKEIDDLIGYNQSDTDASNGNYTTM